MRLLTVPMSATALLLLAGCGLGASPTSAASAPHPSRSASASPSQAPAAAGVTAPTLAAGEVFGGAAAAHRGSASARVSFVVHSPVAASASADAATVIANCAGEYDADALAAVDAQLVRIDYSVTTTSGDWGQTGVRLRPDPSDSDSIGITAGPGIVIDSDAESPHCRRGNSLVGAGITGSAIVVVPSGVDWRELVYGFSSDSGADPSAAVTFTSCAWVLGDGVEGPVKSEPEECAASLA